MSTLKVFIKEYSEEMNKNFAPEKIDITRPVEFSVKAGYDFCQKEYEEKLRWIPVEEKLPPIDIPVILKFKDWAGRDVFQIFTLRSVERREHFLKTHLKFTEWRYFL